MDDLRLCDSGHHGIRWIIDNKKQTIVGAWCRGKHYSVGDIYNHPLMHDLYHKKCKELATPLGT